MSRSGRIFFLLALAFSVCLAIFAAPFSSSLPDGLEKVAQDYGFLHQGEGGPVWRFSPAADYLFPGIESNAVATALAGLLGTLMVFGSVYGLATALSHTHMVSVPAVSNLTGWLHGLDARVKIISFFTLVFISVSTSPRSFGAFAGYSLILAGLAVSSRVPAGYLLRRAFVVVPFVAMVAVFLPFLNGAAGWLIFWNVLVKSLIGVVTIALLMATTPFSKLLQGFEQLHIPKVFVMLLGFSLRYFYVLTDEVGRMRRARDSRCYGGQWFWHARVIGQMIGTLFLRSYERGERVYLAMVARGFDGQAMGLGKTDLRSADYIFLAGSVALGSLVRVLAP
ncbi:MAG: cobalt ECF transporter T component CbiQ [Acidobacteriota bacterium]